MRYLKYSYSNVLKRRYQANATLANVSIDFDVKIINVTFDIRVSEKGILRSLLREYLTLNQSHIDVKINVLKMRESPLSFTAHV